MDVGPGLVFAFFWVHRVSWKTTRWIEEVQEGDSGRWALKNSNCVGKIARVRGGQHGQRELGGKAENVHKSNTLFYKARDASKKKSLRDL